MKVLFASIHPISDEQVKDLHYLFGPEVEIIQENITWETLKGVENIASCYDYLIGVFPQYLAVQLGYCYGLYIAGNLEGHNTNLGWTDKILTSVSTPIFAEDGKIRKFEHKKFVCLSGRDIEEYVK